MLAAVLWVGCGANDLYIADKQRSVATAATAGGDSPIAYRVFLIGDAGLYPDQTVPGDPSEVPVLDLLQRKLRAAGEKSAAVFLGDNIYCCGMPDSSHRRRDQAEQIMRLQLDAVREHPGRVVFIPGNHDWNRRRANGWRSLWREEAFIESYLDRGNVFLPDSTAPGPVEIEFDGGPNLVVFDTQWWLSSSDARTGAAALSPTIEEGEVLLNLDDMIQRHRNEKVLVVGHHPMMSNGRHAGNFPARTHFFPLTEIHPKLYVPVPILGSAYPMYRRFIGSSQDLGNARYAHMRRAFTRIFSQHEGLIYAAGHEHNLQYFREGDQHYLVSGSGSYPKFVARGRGARFTYSGTGFLSLEYHEDGAVWMEAWAPAANRDDGRLLYRTQIEGAGDPAVAEREKMTEGEHETASRLRDSTVTAAVNPAYLAGPVEEFFLGRHNRYAWSTPVTAPLFHTALAAGGLTPLQRAGSAQTPGLRLRGSDGHEYVLRSIDKDPLRSLPEDLQTTFVRDIRQDQTSTMHPFAAFLVPDLADAIDLYHANPRLYYVPETSGLGIYASYMANRFALLEERPDEDVSDFESFGRSEEAMSYRRVYRKINEDNDHRVDQWMFARARLFDILLADWDRHPDQWRWVSFEPPDEKGKIYRPVPRDRDFAFFRLDGLFPWFVKKLVLWEYQDFTRSFGNIKGLTENGLLQDRRFTAKLEREDWQAIADSMQSQLSDAVIDSAVDRWKTKYDPVRGDEIGEVLKVRRDRLSEAAMRFYGLLAEHVDVVGSRKHERFEIDRLDSERTRVHVYSTTREGETRKRIYARTIQSSETEQVRLFGLDGRDQFIVRGRVADGPRIIAVGGPGPDRFDDRSRVGGMRQRTLFQDTGADDQFLSEGEASIVRVEDPVKNTYDPANYRYDRTLPLARIGYDIDDGLTIGGGARIVKQGFQKSPYARLHRLEASIASKTRAVTASYEGEFVDAIRELDVGLRAELWAPNNVRNFYGLSNETLNTGASARSYQVEFARANLLADVIYGNDSGLRFSVGPSLDYTDIARGGAGFAGHPQAGVSPEMFDDHLYVGLGAASELRSLDNTLNPRQGLEWASRARVHHGFSAATGTYGEIASTAALFVSPRLSPQVTFAMRVGAASNIGEFPFYHANTLGGQTNLRGYRGTRFAGRTIFFQNFELRLAFRSFSSYLARGRIGTLAFVDNGRVWADGEHSNRWHQGYGGGLWISLFDRIVLTGMSAFSEEGHTFTTRLGFMF